MNLDAELGADQARQLPSANRLARDQPRLQEGEDLALDLVGAAGAWPLWDQSRNPCSIEVRLRLVVGRPGDAILVGSLRNRRVVDRNTKQKHCLYLYGVF